MLIENDAYVIQELIDETHRVIRYVTRNRESAQKKTYQIRMRTTNIVEVFLKIDI